MADNRFSSSNFSNSNYSKPRISSMEEDWDNEADANKVQNNKQWSQSFERQDFNSPRFSQDSFRPYENQSNAAHRNDFDRKVSRSYLIDSSEAPRLIGRGGLSIKQIQRDYNVQVQISPDRQSQWIDLVIAGSNDQLIDDAFHHIQNVVGGQIKEKPPQNHSGSFFPDSQNTNRSNYSNGASNTFRSRDGGFANSSSFSRGKSGRASNRRYGPADGEEDEEYNAFFASDDEGTTNSINRQEERKVLSTAFSSTSSSTWNSNNGEPVKRVDWAKMRRTDTNNDMSKWKDFPPVMKQFYRELPDIAQMSSEDVQALRAEKNNIVVSWFDPSAKDEHEEKHHCQVTIPNPIYEFAHAFHNYPEIMNEIAKQHFLEPSPIQCQAWPVALSGLDFIGIAQTGTGKTLAFLLPALIHIDKQPRTKMEFHGPKALILSPTRELAIQIHQEIQKYNYRGIRSAVIYGGSSRKHQIFQCETGVEIIIATPGRLNDLVMSNVIDLRAVTFLVLDEADRMLDMGFEPQIMKILLDIRPDRHTIMTSATWPEDVRRIAKRYMRNPVQIYIGTLDLTAVHSVHQEIEIVKEEEKFDLLLDFIGRMDADDKAIIFVDRKATADAISSELIRKHVSCQSIHGDREQSDREQALEDLKLGTVKILVATDVASRGLDILDITVVFNYDLPKSMEDYVHRVGRTGRAGRTGYAISLVTRENWGNAGRLIRILEEAGQRVPGELREMAERFHAMQERKREFGRGGGGGGGGGRYRGNDSAGRFFGLGSTNSRGGSHGRDRERAPVMNSGWSFSS